MTVAYPTDIPVAELKTLFNMLTGKVEADLETALHAGWNVQGYLQGLVWPVTKSEPAAFKIQMADGSTKKVPKLNDQQAVAALGYLAGNRKASGDFKAEGLLDGIGRGAIRSEVAKMLLPILIGWIEKWVAGGGLDRLIEKLIGQI